MSGSKSAVQQQNLPASFDRAKQTGAYFTPEKVVRSLVKWAVRSSEDRLLDPACGDGRFVAQHARSVGIELDADSSASAMQRAPSALIHTGDFFTWAGSTRERFECAAGNPPFIRYQLFTGEIRKMALELCSSLGAQFSALSSSWPLFLVATAHLLRPGGRMAFVVPAEIGHAPYSAPLIKYLATNFGQLHVIAIRKKIFPRLSEDCWLLYAAEKNGRTTSIDFTALTRFASCEAPPRVHTQVDIDDWQNLWNMRLRPYLMPIRARELYQRLVADSASARLREFARINIGYVSGANDFFHFRPSEIEKFGIPDAYLQTTVRYARALPPKQLNKSTLKRWLREDRETLLLRLHKNQVLPKSVKAYLRTSDAQRASTAYKCRMRDPWYVVPDVKIPDFFLSYMSGRRVSLVRNIAGCACTNSLHTVQVRNREALSRILAATRSPLFQFSCEIEGHPLGGGLLKLEPREAGRIFIPLEWKASATDARTVQEGVHSLQSWRHYETA